MSVSEDQLRRLLEFPEDEHVEFKAARQQFDTRRLMRYLVALANEGGGKLVLGVSDRRPRKIVGTGAFTDVRKVKGQVRQSLHMHVGIDEVRTPQGRVLVLTAPPRPQGTTVSHDGAYWMRSGEDLVAMPPDRLKSIIQETILDYSAELCPGASVKHLDAEAVNRFQRMWAKECGRRSRATTHICRSSPSKLSPMLNSSSVDR